MVLHRREGCKEPLSIAQHRQMEVFVAGDRLHNDTAAQILEQRRDVLVWRPVRVILYEAVSIAVESDAQRVATQLVCLDVEAQLVAVVKAQSRVAFSHPATHVPRQQQRVVARVQLVQRIARLGVISAHQLEQMGAERF